MPRLIVLVARGASDNAALFGRCLLEITAGIPAMRTQSFYAGSDTRPLTPI